MLRDLSVRDILLVEALDLEFGPGLNVLTGETGAGKSILLDCLGFVLGWRGRAEVVRQGADAGEVTAVFEIDPDHPAHEVLDEAGIPSGDELILRRVANPDGRKRAFVNDRRASGDVLRGLSDTLVELHGQQDDKGLLSPRTHRALLDDYAGAEDGIAATRSTWRAWRDGEAALAARRAALLQAREEADFVTHALKELDDLGPEPGEDAALDAQRRLMKAAERIREDVMKAAQAIGGDGATGATSDAIRWLEDVAPQAEGRADAALDTLGRALNELAEAEREIGDLLRAIAADPAQLEQVEDRLFALRGLARKHNVLPDELPALADEFRAKAAAIETGDQDIAALEAEVEKTRTAFTRAAENLSARRQQAAHALDAAMAAELAPLKMERAVFSTAITAAEPGPEGHDDVSFRVATNPGAPDGPLAKIASGGELSRFLLALKVCLAGNSGVSMIFDEIDRGVGGATADAVGRRLAALADGGQLLVVTHSPQVAALGLRHWRVQKSVTGDVTRTDVVELPADARRDEIARMLSGETVTDAAREAAAALLAG